MAVPVAARRSDLARGAEGAAAPSALRFDWLFVAVSAWFVVGGALDVWAHFHVPQLETFFTPWHGVLYSGVLALAAVTVFTVARARLGGASWSAAMPVGYELSLFGLLFFFVGGFADGVWHTLLGVEVDVEALVSPPHLLLNTAMGLVVTGPLRAAWRRTETRLSPGAAVPMLVSVALLLYSIGFMTTYVHPFGRTWAAAEYGRAAADVLVAVPHTLTRQLSVAMLFQFLGVTSVLLQSAILSGPVLLLVRRWGVGLPFGSFGLVFGLLGLLMALPRDLHLSTGPLPIVAVAVAGGLMADLLLLALRPGQSRVRPSRAYAFLVPVALFGLYFAVLGPTVGLWWSPHLVGGTVLLGGLVGWLMSFLVFPPAPGGAGG